MTLPFLSRATLRCGTSALVLTLAWASAASAQTRWGEEYAKRISATQVISPLSDESFGDQINLFNGTTKFQVTDISIPGNSGLPVELTRSFDTQDTSFPAPLGEWQLVLPHLSGVFDAGNSTGLKCINAGQPPMVYVTGTDNNQYLFRAKDYWSGNSLNVAGSGTELLKIGTDPKTPKPNFAVGSEWTTKDGWYFDCLPSVQSGAAAAGFTANPANAVGEGFIGYAPNGSKYTFAWKVVRDHPPTGKTQRTAAHCSSAQTCACTLLRSMIVSGIGSSINGTAMSLSASTQMTAERSIWLTVQQLRRSWEVFADWFQRPRQVALGRTVAAIGH